MSLAEVKEGQAKSLAVPEKKVLLTPVQVISKVKQLKSVAAVKSSPSGTLISEQPKPVIKYDATEGQAGVGLNLDFSNFIKQEQEVFNMMNPFASKTSRQQSGVKLKEQIALGQEQFQPYKKEPVKVLTSPLATTLYTLPISYGAGAGLGALKSVSVPAAKIVGGALAGYAITETGRGGIEAYKSGNLVNYAGQTGLQFALAGPLFKRGYTSVGGRVEQALYLRKTFPKGSPEYVRLQSATKVSRLLENVKPVKTEPLQLEKIERFTPETAVKTKEFFVRNPKEVVGGSAAAYSQVENARAPRDIDILIQSRGKMKGVIKQIPTAISERKNPLKLANELQVARAKKFFGSLQETAKGEHAIDIHGREMYTPGTEHRFGFQTKQPIKVGEYRLMRSGEQLFRKAVGGTTKETEYRWYKDIPDFITTAESQIKSAKQSFMTRSKGLKAERYLETFKKGLKGTEYEIKTKADTNLPEFIAAPEKLTRTGMSGKIERLYDYAYKGGRRIPMSYPYPTNKPVYPSVTKYPGYKATIKTQKPYVPSKKYKTVGYTKPPGYKPPSYTPKPYVPVPFTPKPYTPTPPYRPKTPVKTPYTTKQIIPRYVQPVSPYNPENKGKKTRRFIPMDKDKMGYLKKKQMFRQGIDYRQRGFKLGETFGGKFGGK